jgi:hypothetical protein
MLVSAVCLLPDPYKCLVMPLDVLLCWSMILSFSSIFAWPKITSSPFQTVSICLYSSQFTLQHHTVKWRCNDFQWKTFTVWTVNWKKLSSEMPLNSEVQIYQHCWGICCLHHQGSFTLVLIMKVPQSSKMLVIMYGIPHQFIIRVFINNKSQTLFKFPLIHQTVSSLKHNVSISSFSICSTDRYIPATHWHDTEALTHLPSCPVQLDIYVTAPAGLLLLP